MLFCNLTTGTHIFVAPFKYKNNIKIPLSTDKKQRNKKLEEQKLYFLIFYNNTK